MEDNENDTNHPDSDVLLPPRKRLLAGLKRQSPSQSSPENSVSPFPYSMEFDSRLQKLLRSYKNGPQMSSKEIARAAKKAAVAAAKAAKAARAAAEEKAIIAANAVAAAKNALRLVANSSMETGRHSKKNKMKKQIPVECLYKQQHAVHNSGAAEEDVARKQLHMGSTSAPKHKKLKPNHGALNGMKLDSIQEENNCNDREASRSNKSEQVEEIGGQQNKLHLSLCSYKDRADPKDSSDGGNKAASPKERNAEKCGPIEDAPAWKCQDYNVPQCINKVVQS